MKEKKIKMVSTKKKEIAPKPVSDSKVIPTVVRQKFAALSMNNATDSITHIEKPNLEYVLWGENHYVPQMYIGLRDNSPVHGSIVDSKSADIVGEKIIMENPNNELLKAYLSKINRYGNTAFDELTKIAGDFALFGGFAYQIIYNKAKTEAEIFHLPFETVVPGKKDEAGIINNYFVSEDWTKSKPKYTMIPAYTPEERGGSQIYRCIPYTTGCNYFPKPEYAKGIISIQTEIRLNTLKNAFVKNGFFASAMLNFNNGVPLEEEADEIYKDIVKAFGGDENAGKLLVNFANSKDEAAEIEILPITDADKLFTAMEQIVESKIHKAHRITSPMLVGDKTAGQLGGNNEILIASELYYNTVIKPKQKRLESEFNYLLKNLGFTDGVKIIPNQPVSFTFSENILKEILTPDELRAKIGYKPLGDVTTNTNSIN